MENKRKILEESQAELYKILKAIKGCAGEVPVLYRRKTELEDTIVEIGYEYQQALFDKTEKRCRKFKALGRRLWFRVSGREKA